MNLKDDYIVSVSNFEGKENDYLAIITDQGTGKRVKLDEFEKASRAKRGLLMLREVKTKPYRTIFSSIVSHKDFIGLKLSEIKYLKSTELPIMDRYSTGSTIEKGNIREVFVQPVLLEKKNIEEEIDIKEEKVVKKPSLKEIDDRLMTIDDFIDIDI